MFVYATDPNVKGYVSTYFLPRVISMAKYPHINIPTSQQRPNIQALTFPRQPEDQLSSHLRSHVNPKTKHPHINVPISHPKAKYPHVKFQRQPKCQISPY